MESVATASPLSNKAIAEYARRVGDHYSIYADSGKADVERLVSLLGGQIIQSREIFEPEALTVFAPGSFAVHLPPITSARRDRFTMAHELGHYFLHYVHPGLQGSMSFARGGRNPAETQANYFAAALLMPAGQFREAFGRLGADWWAISETFEVSPSAAEVRAQVLGLG